LAEIHENQGKVAEAATVLQELQVSLLLYNYTIHRRAEPDVMVRISVHTLKCEKNKK